MPFVAENFEKSVFEPLVDRSRGWAITVGMSDREFAAPVVLYDLKDIDKIGERDAKGNLIDMPPQWEIALSAITVVSLLRPVTPDEVDERLGITDAVDHTFYASPNGYAKTPIVPGLDWEESKQVYAEAFTALDEARLRKHPKGKTYFRKFI